MVSDTEECDFTQQYDISDSNQMSVQDHQVITQDSQFVYDTAEFSPVILFSDTKECEFTKQSHTQQYDLSDVNQMDVQDHQVITHDSQISCDTPEVLCIYNQKRSFEVVHTYHQERSESYGNYMSYLGNIPLIGQMCTIELLRIPWYKMFINTYNKML